MLQCRNSYDKTPAIILLSWRVWSHPFFFSGVIFSRRLLTAHPRSAPLHHLHSMISMPERAITYGRVGVFKTNERVPSTTIDSQSPNSRQQMAGHQKKNKTIRKKTRKKRKGRKQIMRTAWLIWACIKQEGTGVDHGYFFFYDVSRVLQKWIYWIMIHIV